jgi:hypothetical protein
VQEVRTGRGGTVATTACVLRNATVSSGGATRQAHTGKGRGGSGGFGASGAATVTVVDCSKLRDVQAVAPVGDGQSGGPGTVGWNSPLKPGIE